MKRAAVETMQIRGGPDDSLRSTCMTRLLSARHSICGKGEWL